MLYCLLWQHMPHYVVWSIFCHGPKIVCVRNSDRNSRMINDFYLQITPNHRSKHFASHHIIADASSHISPYLTTLTVLHHISPHLSVPHHISSWSHHTNRAPSHLTAPHRTSLHLTISQHNHRNSIKTYQISPCLATLIVFHHISHLIMDISPLPITLAVPRHISHHHIHRTHHFSYPFSPHGQV